MQWPVLSRCVLVAWVLFLLSRPLFAQQPAEAPAQQPEPPDAPSEKSSPAAKKKKTPAAPIARPKPKIEPGVFRVSLVDGSEVTGRLSVTHIVCDTEFGQLTVPVTKLHELIPGLDRRPESRELVDELVNELDKAALDDDAQQAAEAESELLGLGPPIRKLLRQHRDDAEGKTQEQLDKILEQLHEMLHNGEADDDHAWIPQDTVATPHFTVVGKVAPESFGVRTKFGELSVRLADIESIEVHQSGARPDAHKSLTIDGTYLAQLKYLSSRIRVEPGDRVIVKASGQISRSGNTYYSSSPEGNSRLGTFSSNPRIYGGTLVAKIGSTNQPIKVGANGNFVARRSGTLQFAIGMRPDYVGRYQFIGKYQLRIRVVRGED